MNHSDKAIKKSRYIKLPPESLDFLENLYNECNYPSVEQMKMTAQKIGVNLLKVENWYKHHRRSLAKKGFISLKTKRIFNKLELTYLEEMFEQNPYLTKCEAERIANHLVCEKVQVQNWYSNKRKRVKAATSDLSNDADGNLQISSKSCLNKSKTSTADSNEPSLNVTTATKKEEGSFLECEPTALQSEAFRSNEHPSLRLNSTINNQYILCPSRVINYSNLQASLYQAQMARPVITTIIQPPQVSINSNLPLYQIYTPQLPIYTVVQPIQSGNPLNFTSNTILQNILTNVSRLNNTGF